jgi:hypothetical protein
MPFMACNSAVATRRRGMKPSQSMANLQRRSSGPRALVSAIGRSLADRSAHGGSAYSRCNAQHPAPLLVTFQCCAGAQSYHHLVQRQAQLFCDMAAPTAAAHVRCAPYQPGAHQSLLPASSSDKDPSASGRRGRRGSSGNLPGLQRGGSGSLHGNGSLHAAAPGDCHLPDSKPQVVVRHD